MISAKIIAHSKNVVGGNELVTFVVTMPKFILAELNTHRMLSRNSASSRAIPVHKMISAVWNTPVVPIQVGKNCKGMSSKEELTGWSKWLAIKSIRSWAKMSCLFVKWLNWLGVHKQSANRYVEPFVYTTVIITASDWGNFFNFRAHPAAQPEFQELAYKMLEVYTKSSPKLLQPGEWHLPFADQYLDKDLSTEQLLKIVTARCARVSYLTFEGEIDHEKDYKLHDSLLGDGHVSPTEHAAMASHAGSDCQSGNFKGFIQYRKTLQGENRINFDPEALLKGRA